MKRLFWLALGAAVGVLLVRRLTQSVQRWTPDGMGERVTEAWHQVRAAAAEREVELRDALGLDGRTDNDVDTVRDNR